MLTEEKKLELEILEICKNSGDIEVGDRFDGVMYNTELGDRPCVCIGKTKSSRLFVTEDKRCYFTVYYGWGEKGGKLAGVYISDRIHFDKPSGADELRSYIKNLKPPTSCATAALRHGYKTVAEIYLEALQKFEEK